jgi:hypothetical protein
VTILLLAGAVVVEQEILLVFLEDLARPFMVAAEELVEVLDLEPHIH